jgi:LEA14-like dessication related protein
MRKIFVFLFLVTTLYSCTKFQQPEFRETKNFKISKLGFDKTNLSMDFVCFNPNNLGVVLTRVDCEIFVENNYLGKFVLDTSINIEKRSEFVIPAKIAVDMKNVYKNGFNVLFNKEVSIKATGVCGLKKVGIKFNWPINYEGKQKFSLF